MLLLQSYDRRKKFLKSDKERERWCSINYNYMTDESDHECGISAQVDLAFRKLVYKR